MSEGASGEKQLDATPHRKDKAKREGNVPRSNELVGTASFAGAALGTMAVLPTLGADLRLAIRAAAHGDASPIAAIVPLVLAPLAAAGLAAIGASFAQAGGLRPVAIKLQPSRLSPAAGFKRMFSKDSAVAAVRGTIAFACAGFAIVPLVRELFEAASQGGGIVRASTLASGAASRAVLTVLAVGGVFAAADYALVRKKWLRDLRMSHDEVKREYKEQEGDPLARSRRKSMHRALVRGSINRVREASFVVTNPTHIAIALRYAPPDVPVPEMLVRAADEGAERVKAMARLHGVPIVENVPLARALFADGDVGRPIPSETFLAVAQVIASLSRAGVLS